MPGPAPCAGPTRRRGRSGPRSPTCSSTRTATWTLSRGRWSDDVPLPTLPARRGGGPEAGLLPAPLHAPVHALPALGGRGLVGQHLLAAATGRPHFRRPRHRHRRPASDPAPPGLAAGGDG